MWLLESKFTFKGLVYAFRYFLISFILGVAFGSFLSFRLGFLLIIIFCSLFAIWQGFRLSRYSYWFLGLCIMGFALGGMLGNRALLNLKRQQAFIKSFDNAIVTLVGRVSKIEKTQKGIYLILRAEEIDGQSLPYNKPNICLYLNQIREVPLLSGLVLKGSLLIGERTNLNCGAYLLGGEVLKEIPPKQQSFGTILLKIKDKIYLSLARNIREPFLSLAKGYILGDDRTTNSKVVDILEKSSMTHIVAVSGFNIAIIFLMANRLLSFFHLSPHKTYYLVVGLGLIFILLSGHPASALRAGIMLSLALGAERLQRMGNAINILLLAATIMLVFNPLILIYDLGFQLSFLASLGLIFRQVLLPKKESSTFKRRKLKIIFQDILQDTIYVLLFVSPLLAYYQGIISLKPLLANLPILPLMPSVTFLIILLVLCSFWLSSLALILGLLVEKIIVSQIFILRIVSQLNFLNFNTGYLSFCWIILYYFFLALMLHFKIKKVKAII